VVVQASDAAKRGLPPSELVDSLLWDAVCDPPHRQRGHQRRKNARRIPLRDHIFAGGSGSGLDKAPSMGLREAPTDEEKTDDASGVSQTDRQLVAKLQQNQDVIQNYFEKYVVVSEDDADENRVGNVQRRSLECALSLLNMLGLPVILDLDLFVAAPDADFLAVQVCWDCIVACCCQSTLLFKVACRHPVFVSFIVLSCLSFDVAAHCLALLELNHRCHRVSSENMLSATKWGHC